MALKKALHSPYNPTQKERKKEFTGGGVLVYLAEEEEEGSYSQRKIKHIGRCPLPHPPHTRTYYSHIEAGEEEEEEEEAEEEEEEEEEEEATILNGR